MSGSIVKIGYCPTRRVIFNATAPYAENRKIIPVIENLRKNVQIVHGLDDPMNELLDNEAAAEEMIRRFRAEGVDALFIAACNFGSEILVSRVAKALGVPVLLWGPRDPAPGADGLRERDSQCGMFAIGKVLRRYNVPFTYLVCSAPESEEFKAGFLRFAAVANVVKRYRNMKILQLSTRPTPFMSVICNEGEMLEQFGAETIPVALDDLMRLVDTLKAQPDEEVQEAARLIRQLAKAPTITDENVLTMAAVKVALKQLIAQKGCCCAAVQCWDAFYRITGVMPCVAHSLLADECIPVACETDVMGAMSAALLQAAAFDENPQFFADITVRHPTDDNAELLWHCGPFPYSLRKKSEDCEVIHSYTLKDREPGFCSWQLQDGDITVIRLDGDHGKYQMFIGEAVTTDGPRNQGTYVWIKTKNWPAWERKLVEGPFIHHVTGCYGHYGEILAEACKYFNNVEVCFGDSGDEIMSRWG